MQIIVKKKMKKKLSSLFWDGDSDGDHLTKIRNSFHLVFIRHNVHYNNHNLVIIQTFANKYFLLTIYTINTAYNARFY